MTHDEHRKLRRVTLLLDCVCVAAAYFLALVARYGIHDWYSGTRWQGNLYALAFVLEILIYWAVFHYRYHVQRRPLITEQDIVDGFISVVKNDILTWGALMLVLVSARTSERLSRLVYFYILIFNVALIYPARMVLRRIILARRKRTTLTRRLLVITSAQHAESVLRHLADTLPYGVGIVGVILYDSDAAGRIIAGVPVIANRQNMFSADVQADEVFVFLPDLSNDELHEIVQGYQRIGCDVNIDLNFIGYHITGRMLRSVGDYSVAHFTAMTNRCRVLDTRFAATDMNSAVSYVKEHVQDLAGQYICFSNVHTTVMARENPDYQAVLDGAGLVFPDGKPIANAILGKGYDKAERIGGPDFMEAMFRTSMDGSVTHYFYGSDPQTIERLRVNLETRYPGIKIVGLVSPPYRTLTPEEDAAAVAAINASGADLIWIGLGAPKQENWMAAHKGKVHGVMLGVGAGFNFHAGTTRRAPVWVQRIGMEWFYRLLQDPKRLFSRYLYTNSKYLWYSFTDRFKRGM